MCVPCSAHGSGCQGVLLSSLPAQHQPGSDLLTVLPWGLKGLLNCMDFTQRKMDFFPAHLSKPVVINAAKETQQQQIQVYYGLWIPGVGKMHAW